MRSELTLDEYFADLKLFLKYLQKTKGGAAEALEDINIADVPFDLVKRFSKLDALNYMNFLATDRKNSAKTRKRKLASLKSFYKCLFRDLNMIDDNPVKDLDYPKLPETLPKYLTLENSLKLLGGVDGEDPYFERDYCIITLFINCGMRLSELVGLNIQHIDLNERSMRLFGKGSKERMIHINDACADAISRYLSERKPSELEKSALFLSKRGTRISARRVQQITENALKNCNLDNMGYSPHKLRHTAATLMYQHGGADTLILKEILGHKSTSTTEIYTHMSNEKLKNAMDASPLANVSTPRRKGGAR